MKPGQRWTSEEDQILRDNYFDCRRDELLALLPGRTWEGTSQRAQRLKLSRGRTTLVQGNSWTEAEDKTLRDMFWDATPDELLEALPKRTWFGIHGRAARLGLKRKHTHFGRERAKREADKPVMDAVIQFFFEYGYGPQRQDISRITGLPHSRVARCVDRLIERGLLVRPPTRFAAVGLAPALRKKLLERERAMRDRVKGVA